MPGVDDHQEGGQAEALRIFLLLHKKNGDEEYPSNENKRKRQEEEVQHGEQDTSDTAEYVDATPGDSNFADDDSSDKDDRPERRRPLVAARRLPPAHPRRATAHQVIRLTRTNLEAVKRLKFTGAAADRQVLLALLSDVIVISDDDDDDVSVRAQSPDPIVPVVVPPSSRSAEPVPPAAPMTPAAEPVPPTAELVPPSAVLSPVTAAVPAVTASTATAAAAVPSQHVLRSHQAMPALTAGRSRGAKNARPTTRRRVEDADT